MSHKCPNFSVYKRDAWCYDYEVSLGVLAQLGERLLRM